MLLRNRTFKLPSSADVALKDGLSTRLKELWTSAAHNSFELFLYAAALRKKYLNQTSNEYTAEFKTWYKTHELEKLMGKLPSFTKYALAGEAVNYFANEFRDGKYVSRLPITRSALYELWLLIDQTNVRDLEKLFYAGGDEDEALIHPSATAADIAAYRTRANGKPTVTGGRRNRKFTIPLATIYVSRDLYKFNKTTGLHEGSVTLDDASELLKLVESSLDTKAFDIRTNIKRISTTFERRMVNASPSRALRKKSK